MISSAVTGINGAVGVDILSGSAANTSDSAANTSDRAANRPNGIFL
jgi:hypothetical protein